MQKSNKLSVIVLAAVCGFLALVAPLHAQTIANPSPALPMGSYTNDYSAPVPEWWDEDISYCSGGSLWNLYILDDFSPVYEWQLRRFAIQAAFVLDVRFYVYGGSAYSSIPAYTWPYDEALATLDDYPDPVTVGEVKSIASMFWARANSLGSPAAPPWTGAPAQPDNVTACIGQLKNAFSFLLDDFDGDGLLDEYEYAEFGSLYGADGIDDDPGGNGLGLLVEMQNGFDPLESSLPLQNTGESMAEVRLFPSFEARYFWDAYVFYERSFGIFSSGWQQYFIRSDDDFGCHKTAVLYSDSDGGWHSAGSDFSRAGSYARLNHVTECQTELFIRAQTDGTSFDEQSIFLCSALSLVSWVPEVELGGEAVKAVSGGKTYYVVASDGASRPGVDFTVDWSDAPDGLGPEVWLAEGAQIKFPLGRGDGLDVEVSTNALGVITGGRISATAPGVYPLSALAPLPASSAGSKYGDAYLVVLAPRLSWPGGRDLSCGEVLEYDGVTGLYSRESAFPLSGRAVWENWYAPDGRVCGHAPQPTLDLGGDFPDGFLSVNFDTATDGSSLTSSCTLSLGGTPVWTGDITHFCCAALNPGCRDETVLSHSDCDCEGADYDGDGLGSCDFRLALGFPRAEAVSGFLWFHADEPVPVTPALFSVMIAPYESALCESNNPGGAISHVRSNGGRGRDILLSMIANGVLVTVSNAACTVLDHTWEITNPGGDTAKIRIHKLSRLGNTLSDHTYSAYATAPAAPWLKTARAWSRTDNVSGISETRVESGDLNDPDCNALCTEVFASEASGRVCSYTRSDSCLVGAGASAVLRETYHAESTFEEGRFNETFADYYDSTNSLVHGKLLLRYGDCAWTYFAYDALGREILRLGQLDGSECPRSFLVNVLPASLEDALASDLPGFADCRATVTDYAPLTGDSASVFDDDVPRTVAEYDIRDGAAFPASKTWTVLTRGLHDDDTGFPLLSVRTERAASPSALFGDAGNAVSTEVSYDIRRRKRINDEFVLDGMPCAVTNEDGTAVTYAYGSERPQIVLNGSQCRFGSRAISRTATRSSPDAPDGIPLASPAEVTLFDRDYGNEVFSGKMLRPGTAELYFDWTSSFYDDQDRLRATYWPDGSFSTNAYSCCRLLWTQDRDGRKTLRSATTGTDSLYYAMEEVSLRDLPRQGHRAGMFYPPFDKCPRSSAGRIPYRVTQHFMDALGRETNTVTRCCITPGVAADPDFVYDRGWRSNETTSYPEGTSDHSVATDARGCVSETLFRSCPAWTESVTTNRLPSGEVTFSTLYRSVRNGSSVSEKRWDGGWTRTTTSSRRTADGRLVTVSVTEASDIAGPVTNSVTVSDFLGRTVSVETPLSSVTYTYADASDRLLSETDSVSGLTTTYHYNALGDRVGQTSRGATSSSAVAYAIEDGTVWRVTTSSVSTNGITVTASETRERMTGLSDALRAETASLTDGVTNTVTTTAYDPVTAVLTTTSVSPVYGTTVTRETLGVVAETLTAGTTFYNNYDPYGRLYHTERKDTGSTSYRPLEWILRNDLGDVSEDCNFYGIGNNYNITAYGYDARGNLVAATNALDGVETRSYDALGRLTEVGGTSYPVRYSYDTQGRRTSLATTRDGLAWDTTTWTFDPRTGLNLTKTWPDGTTVTNTYTPDGLPDVVRNKGISPEFHEYDENRRLTCLEDGDMLFYTYDALGNCVGLDNDYQCLSFDRNAHGVVTNEVYGTRHRVEATVTTELDAYDRPVAVTADGGTVRYAYAADGQLATVSNDAFVVTYLYTADRQDAGYVITTASGVEIRRNVTRDTWRRHLVTRVETYSDEEDVNAFSYTYDALERPVTRGADRFGYNGRSEVVSALTDGVAANYAYDTIGNRLVSTNGGSATAYAANALNQYATVTADGADMPVTYDRWGAMTRFGAYSYSCTERNNRIGLVSTNRPNGRVENLCRSGCDGLDRRVSKSVYLPSEERHEFYYNGWNPVVEKITPSGGTTETVRYVWGKDLSGSLQGAGGVGGLLATQVGGAWYFPAYDANGNITQYVDEDGHVVASYTYDAFGNTAAQSGSMSSVFPFRFSTKYYDSESGLYYYGYRFYSPRLGRWLTRDPIEERGGVNLYGFCGNRTLDYADRLGQFTIHLHLDKAGHVGLTTEEGVIYDYGRYYGKYSTGLAGEVDQAGPNILMKSQHLSDKHVYVKYHFKVCPLVDEKVSEELKEQFSAGKQTLPPDVIARYDIQPNSSLDDAMRYMGSDWSINNNCMTFTFKVLANAANRVFNDENATKTDRRQASALITLSFLSAWRLTPAGIKNMLHKSAKENKWIEEE